MDNFFIETSCAKEFSFCWLAQIDLKKKIATGLSRNRNRNWAVTQMIFANTSRYEQNML